MKKIVLKGRKVYGGVARGQAIVTKQPVAFCAGIDPLTGEFTERGHELKHQSVVGRVLVFPFGKGSSAYTKAAYAMKLAGKAPAAWIIRDINPQTALASVVMRLPAVTDLERDPISIIENGDWITVDGDKGLVEITKAENT